MLSTTFKYFGNVVSACNAPLRSTVLSPLLQRLLIPVPWASVHNSAALRGLDEFFDDEENWKKLEVRVGRPWLKEDLRRKSNSDLHKLWFVLLKERNMLMTMAEVFKPDQSMPSPDRLHRVEEGMANLEAVVRERNRAYFELETGTTGERRTIYQTGPLGLRNLRAMTEHYIPRWMNRKWVENNPHNYKGAAVNKFLRLYREKLILQKRKEQREDREYVYGLLRHFPNIDMDVLQEKFPNLDVRKLKEHKRSQGHWVP